MDKLIIHYPLTEVENQTSIHWAYYENGQIKDKGQVQSLNSLCKQSIVQNKNNFRTHVWINSEAVTLRQVNLPKSQHQHRQTIVPQILEDELNEDIDELHFVCGQRIDEQHSDKQGIYVAIIQKQLIEKILDDFKQCQLNNQCQLNIYSLLPDNLSLDFSQEQFSLYIGEEFSQCRIAPQLAYQFDTTNLNYYFNQLVNDRNTIINLYQANDNLSISLPWDESKIKIIKQAPDLTRLPEDGLQSINLLQGPYAANSHFSRYWQQSKLIIYLLLASVALHLVSVYLDTQSIKNQTEDYQNKSRQLFKDTFPNEKRIINIKAQVQQQLEQLQKNKQKTHFFELLSKVSPILIKSPQIILEQISFDQSSAQLNLYLQSGTFEKLEQFNTDIRKLGLQTKSGVISGKSGKYSTKLTISHPNQANESGDK
ncbi:MAG: hypothetical protein HQL46_01290 [Gammaproteobacteria bacterium]|nr:hypothetical protein [Gammaproteobacteria bacterium]